MLEVAIQEVHAWHLRAIDNFTPTRAMWRVAQGFLNDDWSYVEHLRRVGPVDLPAPPLVLWVDGPDGDPNDCENVLKYLCIDIGLPLVYLAALWSLVGGVKAWIIRRSIRGPPADEASLRPWTRRLRGFVYWMAKFRILQVQAITNHWAAHIAALDIWGDRRTGSSGASWEGDDVAIPVVVSQGHGQIAIQPSAAWSDCDGNLNIDISPYLNLQTYDTPPYLQDDAAYDPSQPSGPATPVGATPVAAVDASPAVVADPLASAVVDAAATQTLG